MKKGEKRVLFLRILLVILIVCNMVVVFLFSSQNGAKSSAVSQKVTMDVVGMIPQDFLEKNTEPPEEVGTTPQPSQKPGTSKPAETTPGETDPEETTPGETTPEETTPEETAPEETTPEETAPEEESNKKEPEKELTKEQLALVQKMHTPIRKLAHMLEFGSLATLTFLLLLTWKGKILWRYGASLGFAVTYAATDELHQLFRDGRGSRFSDVLIDFAGAFIACTLLLIIVIIIRQSRRLVTTHYDLPLLPNGKPTTVALVADLHTRPHKKLIERLRTEAPDIILLAGDIMEARDLDDESSSGYAFLRDCAAIAPTYYSLGNHEMIGSSRKNPPKKDEDIDEIRARVAKTGVTLLHNESALWNGIRICGLTSGLRGKENIPDKQAITRFASAEEFRILLCHHPEYYEPYIRPTNIDLTVCGHAHGGQWRFFGHGFYAPGQGFFPKYTKGVVDGRCVISCGVGDHTRIPRIANPRELVVIRFK